MDGWRVKVDIFKAMRRPGLSQGPKEGHGATDHIQVCLFLYTSISHILARP